MHTKPKQAKGNSLRNPIQVSPRAFNDDTYYPSVPPQQETGGEETQATEQASVQQEAIGNMFVINSRKIYERHYSMSNHGVPSSASLSMTSSPSSAMPGPPKLLITHGTTDKLIVTTKESKVTFGTPSPSPSKQHSRKSPFGEKKPHSSKSKFHIFHPSPRSNGAPSSTAAPFNQKRMVVSSRIQSAFSKMVHTSLSPARNLSSTCKAGIFECECDVETSLSDIRGILEHEYYGVIISEDYHELRMRVPMTIAAKLVLLNVIVVVESRGDDSRISLRRNLGDAFIVRADDFDWFCFGVYRHLQKIRHVLRPFYP